jgi:hypothetical protein
MRYHDQDALNLLCCSAGGWVQLEHTWNVQVRLGVCHAGVNCVFENWSLPMALAICRIACTRTSSLVADWPAAAAAAA